MLGPRLLALLAVASAEPKEQWNGPAGAPKCIDKWQKWTDGFAAGERAITMFSQSYVCDGNDCDVVGAYSPKYSFACATKGPDGQGSTLALDPVAQYTMIGATSEFHSQKTVQVSRGASRASARAATTGGPSQLYQLHPRR